MRILILLFLLVSANCFAQRAKVIYKDSLLNIQIKDYDQTGMVTTLGYMKWTSVKEISFMTRQNLKKSYISDLQALTKVRFEDEPTEQEFTKQIMGFEDYYENHILVYQGNSKTAKSFMLGGIFVSIIGSVIMASEAKNGKNQNIGSGVVIAGGIFFVGGLIGDIAALDNLTYTKKP